MGRRTRVLAAAVVAAAAGVTAPACGDGGDDAGARQAERTTPEVVVHTDDRDVRRERARKRCGSPASSAPLARLERAGYRVRGVPAEDRPSGLVSRASRLEGVWAGAGAVDRTVHRDGAMLGYVAVVRLGDRSVREMRRETRQALEASFTDVAAPTVGSGTKALGGRYPPPPPEIAEILGTEGEERWAFTAAKGCWAMYAEGGRAAALRLLGRMAG